MFIVAEQDGATITQADTLQEAQTQAVQIQKERHNATEYPHCSTCECSTEYQIYIYKDGGLIHNRIYSNGTIAPY